MSIKQRLNQLSCFFLSAVGPESSRDIKAEWTRTGRLRRSRSRGVSTGFTMIELLIVITIIGILTGLVGTNFLRSRARARDAERRANLKDLQTAFELYLNDHGQYPPQSTAYNGNGRVFNLEWGNDVFNDSANGRPETIYMPILPGDPSAPGTQYHYEVNAERTKYRVYAFLENEEDIDVVEGGYNGRICSESGSGSAVFCNYGVGSTNTTMDESW